MAISLFSTSGSSQRPLIGLMTTVEGHPEGMETPLPTSAVVLIRGTMENSAIRRIRTAFTDRLPNLKICLVPKQGEESFVYRCWLPVSENRSFPVSPVPRGNSFMGTPKPSLMEGLLSPAIAIPYSPQEDSSVSPTFCSQLQRMEMASIILKPRQGERGAPRWAYFNADRIMPLEGFNPGQGAISEVLAAGYLNKILERMPAISMQCVVPAVSYMQMGHSGFSKWQEMHGSVRATCSVHQFIENCSAITPLQLNSLDPLLLEFLALVDILLLNGDRHFGNLLFRAEDSKLVFIDHGFILSTALGGRYCWLGCPALKQPPSRRILEVIKTIGPELLTDLARNTQTELQRNLGHLPSSRRQGEVDQFEQDRFIMHIIALAFLKNALAIGCNFSEIGAALHRKWRRLSETEADPIRRENDLRGVAYEIYSAVKAVSSCEDPLTISSIIDQECKRIVSRTDFKEICRERASALYPEDNIQQRDEFFLQSESAEQKLDPGRNSPIIPSTTSQNLEGGLGQRKSEE